jgi:predicted transcriptional regulator
MENKYNSVEEFEDLFSQTNNMKMYFDLVNWKYYREHLDEEIEITKSVVKKSLKD